PLFLGVVQDGHAIASGNRHFTLLTCYKVPEYRADMSASFVFGSIENLRQTLGSTGPSQFSQSLTDFLRGFFGARLQIHGFRRVVYIQINMLSLPRVIDQIINFPVLFWIRRLVWY